MDAKFLFSPSGLLPTVFQEWFFSMIYLKDVDSYLEQSLRRKRPPVNDVEMQLTQ